MRPPPRTRRSGYIVAALATAVVVAVRFALSGLLEDDAPLLPFVIAVMAAAWAGGLRPGLAATALGALAGLYFFVQPAFSVRIERVRDAVHLVVFLVAGGLVSWLCEALHAARRVAEAGRMRLEEEVRGREEGDRRLRASEERLRLVADHAPVLIAHCDTDRRYLFVNRPYAARFGLDPREVVGKRIPEVVGKAAFAQFSRHVDEALAGKSVEFEVEIEYLGHGPQVMLCAYRPEFDPAGRVVVGFVAAITNITARRRAEVAERRQIERRRMLGEAAEVLLTTDEPDAMLRGLFARIAPHLSLDTYFNFMVDEAGDALRLVSCIGIPEETARTITRLEFGQAICGTVAQHRRPVVATFIQGSDDPKAQLVKSFGVRAYACNPLITDGRLLGTLSFASRSRDEFDADELEFLRTICHYVTVAYERLRLVRELREADARKDEFLATLAHELRNPLAPVRNALHLMRLAGGDPAVVENARTMMDRQVGQMVRLIDDLLDVSRISRGKIDLRREQVELGAVLHAALETSRPLVEAAGHDLAVAVPPGPMVLDADPTRLAQVFGNLLNNAARYTPRGGRIRVTAERQGSDAVVAVRDTGAGIPADMLGRVFDLFVQVDRSLEKSQGGLGVGLTLVKRLTEMHGGSVEVRSDGPGRGSEFVVRLPLVVAPVAEPPPAPDAGATDAAFGCRVLVADDNRDAADSLAMLLRLRGHDVYVARDGEEAVALAEACRPQVALLDIGMPRLNGYDTCRRIRERPWGRGVCLVALTGWGQDGDRRRATEAGFDHHLVKPLDLAALEPIIAGLAPVPV